MRQYLAHNINEGLGINPTQEFHCLGLFMIGEDGFNQGDLLICRRMTDNQTLPHRKVAIPVEFVRIVNARTQWSKLANNAEPPVLLDVDNPPYPSIVASMPTNCLLRSGRLADADVAHQQQLMQPDRILSV